MTLQQNKDIALASFRLIETGDHDLAHRIIATDFINLEAADDPDELERHLTGPTGFLATSAWLRMAFADLRFEELEAIAENDSVAVRATMTGRHVGEFQTIAPTGKLFRQRQIHIFAIRSGKICQHAAQRDDLGLLLHLGWRPRPGA